MVFETLGAVNDQGEEVLRQLFTFAAQHLGREFSSYCSRAWGRVSCCLQRSIAQVIVNRIDGRPDEPEPASESLVISDGNVDLSEGERKREGEEGSVVIGPLSTEPLMSKPSIGSELLMSESTVKSQRIGPLGPPPQIPPFPLSLVSKRDGGGGEPATTVNKEINQGTKTLGGGEVGEASDGGREGGGATTHSENTRNIDLIVGRATKTSSSDSLSLGICKTGNTSSRTQVQGSAKTLGTGHFKYSRERCNSVTYIPSSCNSLDSRSSSPHVMSTVSRGEVTHINEHTARFLRRSEVTAVRTECGIP
jgi:hypothetical protein